MGVTYVGVFNMPLTELLNNVYTTAKTIYEQTEISEENKKRCKELFGRLERIRLSVEDLLKRGSDPNRYKLLEECLQKCLIFLNELPPTTIQNSGLSKLSPNNLNFGETKSHQERFEELSKELEKVEGDVTLATNSSSLTTHVAPVTFLYDPSFNKPSAESNVSAIPTPRIPARVTLSELKASSHTPIQFKRAGYEAAPIATSALLTSFIARSQIPRTLGGLATTNSQPPHNQHSSIPTPPHIPVRVTLPGLELSHSHNEKEKKTPTPS